MIYTRNSFQSIFNFYMITTIFFRQNSLERIFHVQKDLGVYIFVIYQIHIFFKNLKNRHYFLKMYQIFIFLAYSNNKPIFPNHKTIPDSTTTKLGSSTPNIVLPPTLTPPGRLSAILFIYDERFSFRTPVERFLLSISSQTFYMDSSLRNGHSVCAHSLNTFALLGKVEIYGPITPVRFVVPLLKRSYKVRVCGSIR